MISNLKGVKYKLVILITMFYVIWAKQIGTYEIEITYQRLGKGHSQVSQHVLGGPIFDSYQIWHVPDKFKPKLTGHIYQLGSFLKWIQGPSISKLVVHVLKTNKVWGVGFGPSSFYFSFLVLNRFWTSWWHRTTTIGITVRPQGLTQRQYLGNGVEDQCWGNVLLLLTSRSPMAHIHIHIHIVVESV